MRILMLFSLGFSVALFLIISQISLIFKIVIGLFLFVFLYFNAKPSSFSLLHHALICFTGSLVGVLYLTCFTFFVHSPLEYYDDKTLYLEARLLDYPEFNVYRYTVLVELELSEDYFVKSMLSTYEDVSELKPGDSISAKMLVNLAEENTKGEAITYYTEKGILLRATTDGEVVLSQNDSNSLKYLPVSLSKALKDSIYTTFPDSIAGIICALVTGNKDNLTDEFYSALSRTGLSHTVAVSGMHLAFLAGVLRFILPKGQSWTIVVLISVMVLFMLMVGSTPSIMRATIMIILLNLAPLFHRERDDQTSLFAAILLILCHNPYMVTHVGFHLSVASVASISYFAQPIKDLMIPKKEKVKGEKKEPTTVLSYCLHIVVSAMATTLAAMILTTPFVAIYFRTISLISPIANVFALWAVTFSFIGGLLTGVVGIFFPVLAKICSLPVIPVVAYLQFIVPTFSKIPFAAVTVDSVFYCIWLLFVYLLVAGFVLYGERKQGIYPVLLAFSGFCLSFMLHSESTFHEGLTGEVIDVGQGQTAFFTLGRRIIVADCGGSSYENTGDLVANRIQNLGLHSLDLLVLSHCDADHANGVIQLMNRVFVEVIAMPPSDVDHALQQEIIKKAEEEGTKVLYVEEYHEYSLGNEQYVRIFPPVATGATNETGITLLLSVGEEDVLLIGDMNASTEQALISRFELPDIEILFVGHHGSRFSTGIEFLDTVTPEIGIISVGANNTYGHPTKEVLDKLEERNIAVFRTDNMGNLHFRLG